VLRLVSLRNVGGVARLVFDLSEAAKVKIWYGTSHWSDGDMVEVTRPGGARQQYWRRVDARVVRMLATDAAGNRSRLVFGRAS
jgi:hypothetical protein